MIIIDDVAVHVSALFCCLLWAAHVVSSALHYAGLTAGSLINGRSQRGQTEELTTASAAQTILQHLLLYEGL